MMNMFTIIGRINNDIKIGKNKNGLPTMTLEVNVSRSYKNIDGEYDNDIIKVRLWNGIANNTQEYCHKGDLVGIKGRIQQTGNKMELIAEKLTFLSNSKER